MELQQAKTDGHTEIPKDELLKTIYLTPDYGRAVAMGSRVKGRSEFDDKNHKITFEHPELFNPDEDVYIYSFDFDVLKDNIKLGENGLDYYTVGLEKLPVCEVKKIKAREILNFYELTNWKEGDEKTKNLNPFKRK